MTQTLWRILGVLVLVAAGMLSLPLAATFLDDPGTENWIVPVQLVLMAAVGAVVTLAIPALARPDASTGRRALTGVWWGLAAAFIGVVVFFLLISGVRGA